MHNFVIQANQKSAAGAFPDGLLYSEPMQLQNNRYFFSVSEAGFAHAFGFDIFLFLQPRHLQTQSEDELLFFQLLDQKTNTIAAHFPVFIDQNKEAYSPGKAPFGSVQFQESLPAGVLAEFLELAKRYLLSQKNCRKIRIKSYPFAYAPAESSLLTDLLLKQDFQISHSEINHHIAVTEADFQTNLHQSARRRLQKCRREGFTFQQEKPETLPEIWNFISHCRQERGYEPPLSLEKLSALFEQFPQHFRLFTARFNNELAAATVAVQVNGRILYNFYPASPVAFNAYSPVVFLTAGLYRFCQQEQIEVLDLGTSNLPTGPNFPLITFKKHLGGEPTLKLSFEFTA